MDEDDDDDDAIKELKCRQTVRFNDEVDGGATGNTVPAARTAAAADAEREAVNAAFKEAAKYLCEAACPIRRLDLHLAKPVISKLAPLGGGNYTANSTCAWKCTLTCLPLKSHQAEIVEQYQRLECDDDWTVIAEGEATGKAIGDKISKNVEAAVYALLKKMLDYKIKNAIEAFECPTQDCENKRIRIMLWPRSKIQRGRHVGVAKKRGTKYEWRATQWYQIKVCCED